MSKDIHIKQDNDRKNISIKFDDIDIEMPIIDFCKITAVHLATKKSMLKLIKDYQERNWNQ